ncbi:MAG TPA: chlorite dismutase family protein [Anaerolineales bacterium]|nr:chlorite dismutase family protein [Anaerolineales bacterium]
MVSSNEEIVNRTLNHFSLISFKEPHWSLSTKEREEFHRAWLNGLCAAAQKVDIFQATETGIDLIVWCALTADDKPDAARFFEKYAAANNPYRHLIDLKDSLWGFTRPSQYSKARSKQEIDPFAEARKPYLIIYPFSKTTEWYLMSREARQGMMNEHIRIGKQHEDISQLLLYSFGLQNQEFVVVYETDDLVQFSELVNELRDTEARRFTLRDTPLHTAIYHPAEETLNLWK